MSTAPRHRRGAVALVPALVVVALQIAVMGTTSGSAEAATAAVRVVDNAYAPAEVTVAVGERVRWTWEGENPHSVTAPGVFDSHPDCTVLTPGACGGAGDRYVWTASEPGTVEYRCRVHAEDMRGTITVVAEQPAPSSPTPSSSAASPTPGARPSSSPAPTPSRSATEAATAPSPRSTPAPAASPVVSPSPSRIPTPAPGASGSAVTVSPGPEPELEPFPAPVEPSPTGEAPTHEPVAVEQVDEPGRAVARLVAVGLFTVTLLAFGRTVLFGPPW